MLLLKYQFYSQIIQPTPHIRYIRCRWPQKAGLINPNQTRIMVATQWLICFLMWPVYAAATGVKLELNRNALVCVYTFADEQRVPHFVFMSLTLIGSTVTIFTNVAMWNIVRKCGRKRVSVSSKISVKRKSEADIQTRQSFDLLTEHSEMSMQDSRTERQSSTNTNIQGKALLTTSVVTTLFLISWIPTLVRYFLASWPSQLIIPPPALDKTMVVTFSLGCWLNPIIYTVINKGFRNFVKGMIRGKLSTFSINSNS